MYVFVSKTNFRRPDFYGNATVKRIVAVFYANGALREGLQFCNPADTITDAKLEAPVHPIDRGTTLR